MVGAAQWKGESAERIAHVQSLAEANRDELRTVYRDLDAALQREMRTLDESILAEIRATDEQLQDEISRNAMERHETLEGVWKEIDRLRDWVDQNRNREARP